MNILVLTGSPRKNGNTEIMAEEFIRGARDAGHTVTKFSTGAMDIHPCIACESCLRNDGKCFRQDDMQKIYPVIEESDMIVLASPVYWYSLTAQLKTSVDRFYAYLLKVSGETETENTPSVGDMTFEFTVNEDGYLKDMHMLFDMTYIEGDGETVYSYDMTMVYTGYNNVGAIEYPDFSDYVDITEEELAL